MTHQHSCTVRAANTWEIIYPFHENELLSNKEQIQTKVASYLQILYFLKCYSPTRVKALINSQSFFFSRGTSEGLDYQSQACTAAMWSQGACASLCHLLLMWAKHSSDTSCMWGSHHMVPSLWRIVPSPTGPSLSLPPPHLFIYFAFLQAHYPHGLKLTVTFSRWLQISKYLWQILRGRIQFSRFLSFSFLFLLSFLLSLIFPLSLPFIFPLPLSPEKPEINKI